MWKKTYNYFFHTILSLSNIYECPHTHTHCPCPSLDTAIPSLRLDVLTPWRFGGYSIHCIIFTQLLLLIIQRTESLDDLMPLQAIPKALPFNSDVVVCTQCSVFRNTFSFCVAFLRKPRPFRNWHYAFFSWGKLPTYYCLTPFPSCLTFCLEPHQVCMITMVNECLRLINLTQNPSQSHHVMDYAQYTEYCPSGRLTLKVWILFCFFLIPRLEMEVKGKKEMMTRKSRPEKIQK